MTPTNDALADYIAAKMSGTAPLGPAPTPDEKATQYVAQRMGAAAAADPRWRDFLGLRESEDSPAGHPPVEAPSDGISGPEFVRRALEAQGVDRWGNWIESAEQKPAKPELTKAEQAAVEVRAIGMLSRATREAAGRGDKAALELFQTIVAHLSSGASEAEVLATMEAAGIPIEESDEEEAD